MNGRPIRNGKEALYLAKRIARHMMGEVPCPVEIVGPVEAAPTFNPAMNPPKRWFDIVGTRACQAPSGKWYVCVYYWSGSSEKGYRWFYVQQYETLRKVYENGVRALSQANPVPERPGNHLVLLPGPDLGSDLYHYGA